MSELIVITGRRGKGKTSRAYHLAKSLGRAVAVFDPTHAFETGAIANDKDSFEFILAGDISPAVFQVENAVDRKDAVETDLRDFVEALRYIRDISVVIDETSYLQSPQWIAPALDDEIRVGRRRRHDLFLTQHRMADCNGILLDLVTQFEFFQTKYHRSLERIAEYCGEHVAGVVSGLQDLEFLHYDVESGLFSVNVKPEFWRENIAPEESAAEEIPAQEEL